MSNLTERIFTRRLTLGMECKIDRFIENCHPGAWRSSHIEILPLGDEFSVNLICQRRGEPDDRTAPRSFFMHFMTGIPTYKYIYLPNRHEKHKPNDEFLENTKRWMKAEAANFIGKNAGLLDAFDELGLKFDEGNIKADMAEGFLVVNWGFQKPAENDERLSWSVDVTAFSDGEVPDKKCGKTFWPKSWDFKKELVEIFRTVMKEQKIPFTAFPETLRMVLVEARP